MSTPEPAADPITARLSERDQVRTTFIDEAVDTARIVAAYYKELRRSKLGVPLCSELTGRYQDFLLFDPFEVVDEVD